MVGPATVLKGKWKLVKKIGQGAFGEIYSGNDVVTQDPVAVKLERWDNKKAVLKMEVAVLKKLQHCQFACRYVHCGHFEDHNYLVMELLGENLSELRRRRPGGRFSLWTTVRIGIQILKAVEAIHEIGYLHRDIKPSNFAMGLAPGRKDQCVMIDFGLTRKYRLPNGQIRPARDMAGFRGTARYASINSHLSKELARRDDLWSVLYVLIEFLTGQLPWRKLKDKEEIGLLKIHFNSAELVRDLPPPYLSFMQHLQALDYLDKPDYNMLADLLHKLGGGVAEQTPYDWDSDARDGRSFGGASDGLNNSSIGSVRRIDTPGREGDVSTNEQQSAPLEERGRALQSFSLQEDGGPCGLEGSSSLVTPGRARTRQSDNSSGSEMRLRSSGRVRSERSLRRHNSQTKQRPEEPQQSTVEPSTTLQPQFTGGGGGHAANMDASVPSSTSSRFVRSAAETIDGSDKGKRAPGEGKEKGGQAERQREKEREREEGQGKERREKLRERLRERQETERAEGRRDDDGDDVGTILANRMAKPAKAEPKPAKEELKEPELVPDEQAAMRNKSTRSGRPESPTQVAAAAAKQEQEKARALEWEREKEQERESEEKERAAKAHSSNSAEEDPAPPEASKQETASSNKAAPPPREISPLPAGKDNPTMGEGGGGGAGTQVAEGSAAGGGEGTAATSTPGGERAGGMHDGGEEKASCLSRCAIC